MESPHESVLKNEVIALFSNRPIRTFVDGTLGAGGHAFAMLSAHPEIETFIGVDQDPDALAIAKERLAPWKNKCQFIKANFASLPQAALPYCNTPVDGILLDIGVSSMQLDRAEKGFSFMRDGPLDMRMDPENPITAEIIVNSWSESELGKIFREYGEEKQWRRAARAIVTARTLAPITTTLELGKVLLPVLHYDKKKRINPLTCIFQALRICVNQELAVLEQALPKMVDWLAPEGILALITFHSLEDRIVKHLFRHYASDKENTSGIGGLFLDKEPTVDLLTKKAIGPTIEEIEHNPRSRSAKLRGVCKR